MGADKWRPIVGCIVNLILNIVMVKTIGVVGVMLSTVISYAFVEIPWETHALFKNYFGNNEKRYYIQLLTSTFCIFISGTATYFLCSIINCSPIISLIIKGVLCVIIPNLIFALLNIRNSDFAKSMMFVRNILKRKH